MGATYSNFAVSGSGDQIISLTSSDAGAGILMTGTSDQHTAQILWDNSVFAIEINSNRMFAMAIDGRITTAKFGRSNDPVGQYGTVSLNSITGRFESYTTNLASDASETITVSNSYAEPGSIVIASVWEACTGGTVIVTQAKPSSGTIGVTVANIGSSACSSSYQIALAVLN